MSIESTSTAIINSRVIQALAGNASSKMEQELQGFGGLGSSALLPQDTQRPKTHVAKEKLHIKESNTKSSQYIFRTQLEGQSIAFASASAKVVKYTSKTTSSRVVPCCFC
jgi:hypothetical protein